jgi:hypothetical protein
MAEDRGLTGPLGVVYSTTNRDLIATYHGEKIVRASYLLLTLNTLDHQAHVRVNQVGRQLGLGYQVFRLPARRNLDEGG